MTVKMREDKRCHVVRVMHNGFIHQQGIGNVNVLLCDLSMYYFVT